MSDPLEVKVPDGKHCPACDIETVLFRRETDGDQPNLAMLFYRCPKCGGEWHTVGGLPVVSTT